MIRASTSFLARFCVFGRFKSDWMRGSVKARVLPEPVQALTHTSLFCKNKGMTAFWTLVTLVKFSLFRVSKMIGSRDGRSCQVARVGSIAVGSSSNYYNTQSELRLNYFNNAICSSMSSISSSSLSSCFLFLFSFIFSVSSFLSNASSLLRFLGFMKN